MPDIVDLKQVSPEDAVADWLEAYRRLLRIDTTRVDTRRRLRNEYQKAKGILAAVLAAAKKRRHIDKTGVYYLAADLDTVTPYPAWRPHEVTKTAAA